MSLSLSPSHPAKSRSRIGPYLASEIATYIEAESLPDGAHLRTAALAERFGVSRWPVEAALKALAEAGRVRHEPNRGFFVQAAAPGSPPPGPAAPDPLHAAYLALARELVQGSIGLQVGEQEMRERFNLTRRQSADLMARLVQEGIAEKRAGYGWNINAELTAPDALGQTAEIRLILEPAALRLPHYHLPAEVIARLRRVEEDLQAGGVERLAPDALYLVGAQFHETVISGAGNPFMVQALARVNRVRRLIAYQAMADRSRYYRQSGEHLAILERLQERDNEGAAALMERHLRNVTRSLADLGFITKGLPVSEDPSGAV